MLVLKRKEGETIEIEVPGSPPVTVRFLAVDSCGRVKVGIEAAQDINIRRGELEPLPRSAEGG